MTKNRLQSLLLELQIFQCKKQLIYLYNPKTFGGLNMKNIF